MNRITKLTISLVIAGLCGQHALATTTSSPCTAGGGVVGGIGLANLLGAWAPAGYSPCPPTSNPYDFNKDCKVDGLDLAIYLGSWGVSCSPVLTQLAGNNLSQYPFFEYVRAFNQGSFIRCAIDPGRFPSIVGKTCNLYVVTHKTAAQWASNPALVDVTTGGFQTQTFAAGTIQANSFSISGAVSLSGTVGTQVGVGYDMICDCNQNGVLDGADYADLHGGPSDPAGNEAGLYVVRDTAAAGPMTPVTSPSYTVTGIPISQGTSQSSEQAFYPSNIASLGQVPLIVMSHGNGHNYLWYSHLGTHMASYGYIVMSHQCETTIGVQFAARTTINHTTAIIGQQAAILGGVLNGHIDSHNIVWMGHSRGAEGVAIATNTLITGTPITGVPAGTYTPVGWTIADVKLVDSLCPVDFLGPTQSNPRNKPHHLWTAAGDADVSGCASSDVGQTFHINERDTAFRQSTVVYGTGHGDFHALGGVFTGPCPIGVTACNQIEKGYWLPLVKRYLENDIPSKDFLVRRWESFKPIGAPASGACAPPSGTGLAIIVDHWYRDDPATLPFIIDDNLTNPSTALSSSGGAVTFNVTNILEGRNDDNNGDFTWSAADPMNGNTLASAADTSNGVVFDWTSPSFYQIAIAPSHQNWTNDVYLSLRAAQGTRHPNTTAALEVLTFDVVLVDGAGNSSRINIGAYGGGVEEPYQRTSCGTGAGWHNDFGTFRVRLSDFLNNGSALNLANIVALRLEFGGAGTSPVGRLALNQIHLTND